MTIEAPVYAWQSLSFPFWKKSTQTLGREYKTISFPPKEEFEKVGKLLKDYINVSLDREDDGEWLCWKFGIPISDERRVLLQDLLEKTFGKEVGQEFQWRGFSAYTRIQTALSLGRHVQ